VTTVIEANSRLAHALRTERLIVTAESRPPRGAGGVAIPSVPATVCALVVPDNHEEIRASALSCALQLLHQGIEPVLTLVTRDRNRIALQSEVLGAAALGVTNFFCVSGHHQSLGVAPEAASAFDIDPIQLLQSLAAMRDEGVLLGGERVEPPPVLFLGAAAHPFLQPMGLNLIQTKKKVASGAQFLLTQPIWDVDGLAQWMTAVRDLGLCEKTHILATVGPLASVEEAEALRKQHPSAIPESVVDRMRKATDAAREGVAICAEMAARAKDIEGIRGIHILSGDREETVTSVLQQAGLARA
jgi:methylenetetrahydrofolate reductase (NADPH)